METSNGINNIFIVGQGCIATTLAYYLNDSNLRFIQRVHTFEGLKINYKNNLLPVPGKPILLDDIRFQESDSLLIPIKSYQNAKFIAEYKDKVPKFVTIVIFQNGIQFLQDFKRAFPNNPIIAGLSTDGAFRDTNNVINLAGKGTLILGSIQYAAKSMVRKLINAHPDARWSTDIYPAIYKKLLVNIAINPLTFINQCRNGDLMSDLSEVRNIVDEVFSVYDRLNVEYDRDNWFEKVVEVIKGTANNRSSMLQDRLNKAPTEIDSILGVLLQQAETKGVKTPLLSEIYQCIRKVENS